MDYAARQVGLRVMISAFVVVLFGAAVLCVVPDVALAAESPVVEVESAEGVTSTDAILSVTINTNDWYTAYEFEVDTNSSYGYTRMACPLPLPEYSQCMAITVGQSPPVKEPLPEQIPTGSGVRVVSLDLAKTGTTLQPGMTYHYRVIAANTSNGQIVDGPDQIFTTAGASAVSTTTSENEPSTAGMPSDIMPSIGAGTSKSSDHDPLPGKSHRKHKHKHKHKKSKKPGKKPRAQERRRRKA